MNEGAPADLTRRRFLRGLGATAAATSAATTLGLLLRDDPSPPALGPASLRRIGEAYLRAHPEVRAEALRAELPPGVDLKRDLQGGLTRLRDRVRQDYVDGAVEVLDGWRLSRTALRAAALVALGG